MSIFNKDTFAATDSFRDALKKVSESGVNTDGEAKAKMVNEEDVHVHGYGIVSKHIAQREAHASVQEALRHSASDNHQNAAYHLDRAAMFHRALHHHAVHTAETSVKSESVAQPAVAEETKEPDVGRVESKYKRHLARNMKKKDAEKKDKKEDRYQ